MLEINLTGDIKQSPPGYFQVGIVKDCHGVQSGHNSNKNNFNLTVDKDFNDNGHNFNPFNIEIVIVDCQSQFRYWNCWHNLLTTISIFGIVIEIMSITISILKLLS